MFSFAALLPLLLSLTVNDSVTIEQQREKIAAKYNIEHFGTHLTFSNTNEGRFFKSLYEQEPTKYYALDSCTGCFYANYTKDNIWLYSFLIVDSTKQGEAKYLKEYTDEALKCYLPDLHFYYGANMVHWEYPYAPFTGFLYKDQAYLTGDHIEQLAEIFRQPLLPTTEDREAFATAYLNTLYKGTEDYYHLQIVSTSLLWSGDDLKVTHFYAEPEKGKKYSSYLSFKSNSVQMSFKDNHFTAFGKAIKGVEN